MMVSYLVEWKKCGNSNKSTSLSLPTDPNILCIFRSRVKCANAGMLCNINVMNVHDGLSDFHPTEMFIWIHIRRYSYVLSYTSHNML